MNYFTGNYALNEIDIPPKSQFIILPTGIYIYTTEKKTGFFLEDLFHHITHDKLKILRDPVCALVEDNNNYYIIFINDPRMRETISYEKSELDDESLELILDSFKNEFNYFIMAKIDEDNEKVIYSLNNSNKEEVSINDLKLQYIRSAIDIFNKKILSQSKVILKQWLVPVILIISLFVGLYIGYQKSDQYLSNYFKTNITKYSLENKKLKADITKKDREIKSKLLKLKEFNSKKDILDNNPRTIYNILSNTM